MWENFTALFTGWSIYPCNLYFTCFSNGISHHSLWNTMWERGARFTGISHDHKYHFTSLLNKMWKPMWKLCEIPVKHSRFSHELHIIIIIILHRIAASSACANESKFPEELSTATRSWICINCSSGVSHRKQMLSSWLFHRVESLFWHEKS